MNNSEIDITEFFNSADFNPSYYSASIAEIGQDAGVITWQNSVDRSEEIDLLQDAEKREIFRRYIKTFGAWTDDEINVWTNVELNALLIQLIAGDIREAGLDVNNPDWKEYEKGAESGRYSGRLYGGSLSVDGRVYYSIGD